MNRSLARCSLGIAIVSALCLSFPICEGRASAAAVPAKDNAKAKQAKQFYKEGQYEEAAKLFSNLSMEYPDKLVFTRNLGACYYYLRRPEPAVSNLREYLKRSKDITKEDRGEVEDWIAAMEKLREQSAAAAATAPLPAAAVPAPATQLPLAAASPSQPAAIEGGPGVSAPSPAPAVAVPVAPLGVPAASVAEAPAPSLVVAPASSGASMRVAGIACGAVGLASIATGVFFYTRATSLSDTVTTSDAPSASDYQSGKTAQTMQWVFYSVGVAAVATGSVLYYLGRRADVRARTAVAPMVGPGMAGLSAKGVF